MTWEPRPSPVVTPENEPYWTGGLDGELRIQRCRDCELVYVYPRAHCPDCLGDGVEWVVASGRGTVYSYTVAHQVAGWPDAELPLVNAYVELDEGPRLMTNLVDCDPEDVAVGISVEVRFEPSEDGAFAVPVFTPV